MVRQLLSLQGMWKPILSRKGNVTPYPNTLLSLSGNVTHLSDGVKRPPAIASLRTRFNPRLIGFGIAALSILDSGGKEDFLTAPDAGCGERSSDRSPEVQK